MRSTLCAAALLGASLAAAVPTASNDKRQGWGYKYNQGDMGQNNDSDQFPIKDGFPAPNNDQLNKIEDGAHGTLSNAPPPPPLNPDTLISLKFIATNELVEVVFMEQFLLNITNKVDGFGDENFVNDDERQFVIDAFTVHFQQEELHFLNANGALTANGQPPIEPAQYMFPVNNFQEGLAVINILTDNILAVLQDVARRAGDIGDDELINGFVAVCGQEGEQNGFYRTEQVINNKHTRVPAAMPFYTGSDRNIAFSGLEQNFIKPGTDKNDVPLKVFLQLILDTKQEDIKPENQDLQFEINLDTKVGNDFRGNNEAQSDSNYGSGSGSAPSKASSGPHKRQEKDGSNGGGPIQSSAPSGSDGKSGSDDKSGSGSESDSDGKSGSGSGSEGSEPSFGPSGMYGSNFDWGNQDNCKDLYVTYITEQNVPISEPLKGVQFDKENKKVKFTALFPAGDQKIHGFAIGMVTHGSNFTNPEDVANNSIAGPASIELID